MRPYLEPPWTNSHQISGHHEPIHIKLSVWGFFIIFWNGYENIKMQKRNFNDITLQMPIGNGTDSKILVYITEEVFAYFTKCLTYMLQLLMLYGAGADWGSP